MLADLTLREFLAETASDAPAPGGGSVSALAGALGAALAVMVANLSRDSAAEAVAEIRAQGETLRADLTRAVDEDTAAFNAVMAAFKLPKTTDAEKAARSGAIQTAMKRAASLPMTVAEACVRVMRLSGEALRQGNPNAASDAAVSGRIAYAGMWGAVYNVRINLASIKDEAFAGTMRSRIAATLADGEARLADITAQTNAVLAS